MNLYLRSALLAAVFYLISGCCCARASSIPEKLDYELTWAGVKVGTSSIQTAFDGPTLETVSKVNSEPWSAPFYKVEDLEISRLEKVGKGFALRSYKMKLHEGRNDWNRAASLDRKAKKFNFVNLLSFEKSSSKLVEPAWDPVSCLYYLRQLQLTPGKSVVANVLDKGKLNRIKINILRRETIQTPAGTFRTIVVSPQMDIESQGLFYARGPLTIWLTDDGKKVPVMIEKRIENLFKDGIPVYLQQFTPAAVRKNMPKMETIRASLVGGSWQ